MRRGAAALAARPSLTSGMTRSSLHPACVHASSGSLRTSTCCCRAVRRRVPWPILAQCGGREGGDKPPLQSRQRLPARSLQQRTPSAAQLYCTQLNGLSHSGPGIVGSGLTPLCRLSATSEIKRLRHARPRTTPMGTVRVSRCLVAVKYLGFRLGGAQSRSYARQHGAGAGVQSAAFPMSKRPCFARAPASSGPLLCWALLLQRGALVTAAGRGLWPSGWPTTAPRRGPCLLRIYVCSCVSL